MNCPNCGGELKQLPKNPRMYRCQNCREYFEWTGNPGAQYGPNGEQSMWPPTTPENPKKNTNIIVGIAVTAIAVAVIAILIAIAAIRSESDNDNQDQEQSSEQVSDNQTDSDIQEDVTTVETQASTEADGKTKFQVGETAEYDDLQITILSYEESSGNDWAAPQDGYVFVYVNIEIAKPPRCYQHRSDSK